MITEKLDVFGVQKMNDKKALNVVLKNLTKCVAKKNLFHNKLEITILEPYYSNTF